MTKKHFIALANIFKSTEPKWDAGGIDVPARIQWHRDYTAMATALKAEYPRFNVERWIGYIEGRNGVNGGKVK